MMNNRKKNEISKYIKKHSTLCWTCNKACGGCSWSKKFIPVDGWNAIPTKLLVGTNPQNKAMRTYVDSFDVYGCPEFELLEMLR